MFRSRLLGNRKLHSLGLAVLCALFVWAIWFKDNFASVPESTLDEIKQAIYLPSTAPRRISYLGATDTPIQLVKSILHNVRNGFFIESGAYDGETNSQTLHFEVALSWTGILIEPNPEMFERLMAKNRKCYAINACLGVKKHRSIETFHGGVNGHASAHHLVENLPPNDAHAVFTAVCYPIYYILRALNVTTVHFWILDVEGAEYGVLLNVPFDLVDIKVIMVEYLFFDMKQELISLLRSKNYFLVAEFIRQPCQGDLLFVKEGVIPKPDMMQLYDQKGKMIQHLGVDKFVFTSEK